MGERKTMPAGDDLLRHLQRPIRVGGKSKDRNVLLRFLESVGYGG